MATIEFYAGEAFLIYNASNSGLGFYGDSGFGYSVAVGSYNGRTFITNSNGTIQGPEVDNVKYSSTSGVIWGQVGSGMLLTELPNYLSTLNIRFTHDSAVQIQNPKLYAFDRVNKDNFPSGVTFKAASIIHPTIDQTNNGSGDALWQTLSTGSNLLTGMHTSPGMSGLSISGSNTMDVRHDWYVALSLSPTSVGSKTSLGLLFELEYL